MNQSASPPSAAAPEDLPSAPCLEEQAWGPLTLTREGILLLDAAGSVTAANARALELLRCTLPALTGHSFWLAVPAEVAAQHQDITEQVLRYSERHAFIAHQKPEKARLNTLSDGILLGMLSIFGRPAQSSACSACWKTANAITS